MPTRRVSVFGGDWMQKPLPSGSRITVHVSDSSPIVRDFVSTSFAPISSSRCSSARWSGTLTSRWIGSSIVGDFSIRLKNSAGPSPVARQLSPADSAE